MPVECKNKRKAPTFSGRNRLKAMATEIECSDTSNCYPFQKFYLIPVIITYKLSEDYWPFLCKRNFYELKMSNSGLVRFQYDHQLITIITIRPQKAKLIFAPDLPQKKE